jgi:hypothetical protein
MIEAATIRLSSAPATTWTTRRHVLGIGDPLDIAVGGEVTSLIRGELAKEAEEVR